MYIILTDGMRSLCRIACLRISCWDRENVRALLRCVSCTCPRETVSLTHWNLPHESSSTSDNWWYIVCCNILQSLCIGRQMSCTLAECLTLIWCWCWKISLYCLYLTELWKYHNHTEFVLPMANNVSLCENAGFCDHVPFVLPVQVSLLRRWGYP